jgi:hypothetical protein
MYVFMCPQPVLQLASTPTKSACVCRLYNVMQYIHTHTHTYTQTHTHITSAPTKSACVCIKRLFAVIPPSTRILVISRPASFFIADTTSTTCMCMYVCMHVCMQVCMYLLCLSTPLHTNIQLVISRPASFFIADTTSTTVCICMYVCMHVCICYV